MRDIFCSLRIPFWINPLLKTSGIIGMLTGAWHILSSATLFSFMHVSMPVYQPYMTWVGILMIVLGLLSVVVSFRPESNLGVLLVLFLAKTVISVKLFLNILNAEISANFGLAILLNDTIWIPVYALICYRILLFRLKTKKALPACLSPNELFSRFSTQHGESLKELNERSPVLLIFTRYLGCATAASFFREIKQYEERIKAMGFQIVLVHMSSEISAAPVLKELGADHLFRISDPERMLYALNACDSNPLTGILCLRFVQSALSYFRAEKYRQESWGNLLQMSGFAVIYKNHILFRKETERITRPAEYLPAAECVLPQIEQLNQVSDLKESADKNKVIFHDFRKHSPPLV